MHTTDFALQQATEKARPYKKQLDAALASVIEGNQKLSASYNERAAQLELVVHRMVLALQHGKDDEALKIGMNAICGG